MSATEHQSVLKQLVDFFNIRVGEDELCLIERDFGKIHSVSPDGVAIDLLPFETRYFTKDEVAGLRPVLNLIERPDDITEPPLVLIVTPHYTRLSPVVSCWYNVCLGRDASLAFRLALKQNRLYDAIEIVIQTIKESNVDGSYFSSDKERWENARTLTKQKALEAIEASKGCGRS